MVEYIQYGIVLATLALGLGVGRWVLPARRPALSSPSWDELVVKLTEQLQRTTAELADAKRRADENRAVIDSVLKQRDQWGRLYDEQSIAHGNAQAIMMDAIGFLERKLAKAGIETRLPMVVRETQALYIERHVAPSLERRGQPEINLEIPAARPEVRKA